MKKHQTGKFWTLLGMSILLACFAGCAGVSNIFGPNYKEGVMKDKVLQEAHIRSTAKTSQNITSFADNIYAKPQKAGVENAVLIDESFSAARLGDIRNYYDTTIFTTYCSEKGGLSYTWRVQRDWYAYSGMDGIAKTFVTCEIDGKVNAVLVYEENSRGSGYQGPYPFAQRRLLAPGEYFRDFIGKSRLEGFVSDNRMVTIPVFKVADPNVQSASSEKYPILFNYRNDTQNPVSIDMLNSYVTLNGAKYNVDFKYNNKPIFWQDTRDYNSSGIFVGEQGNKMTRLRFNPGQRLSGQVVCTIPGLSMIKEEDTANLTYVIDTFKCKGFKKMSFYELQKDKI